MIQKISDKELIIRLTDCYFMMNFCYDFIMNNYWDKKLKAVPFEVFEADGLYDTLNALISNKETAYFLYMSVAYHNFLEILFYTVDATIDYTKSLLDKYGDFRYDMDEKDKELESFVEARKDSVRNSKIDSLHLKNDTIENNYK